MNADGLNAVSAFAPRVLRHRERVAVKSPHGVFSHREASTGSVIGVHVVLDVDEFGRFAGRLLIFGDNDGEDVPEIRGAATYGNEHRPIGVDDADPQSHPARQHAV